MSGARDPRNFEEHFVERSNLSKIRTILWMEIGEKVGEMLDLPATHGIHGSNPTKLHHTNKSQKKFRAIFGGDFRIRMKNNKIRLENKERGLRNRDQRGS